MPPQTRLHARHEPTVSRPYMPGYGILDAKSGRGLLPWSWARKRLAKARNYLISTMRANGAPHVMPVWGVWMDDALYFSTGVRSRKGRNLALNPRCAVGIVHEKDEESILVEGAASRVVRKALLKRFADEYQAKYAWEMSNFKEPVYAVRPYTAFAFAAYGDFVGTATRWRFPRR